MATRWRIVAVATLFNILFEYSLRGVNNLRVQPYLPFILFPIYFTLFTMVEDLIVRFKLKDYHVLILSFFYGTIYITWISGIVFVPPLFLGIKWSALFFINIAWWGFLQAILTFYLANALGRRDWNHPRLSRLGWVVCIGVQLVAIRLFQGSGVIPHGTPLGKFMILIVLLISFTVFLKSLSGKREITEFRKSKFLNMLCFATICLFIFSAIILTGDPVRSDTSNINATSLKLISWWTVIVSLALIGERYVSKKEISV